MLGVLQQVFRRDAVAAGRRVARQLQVLLVDLDGIAADAHARPVAVQDLGARVRPLAPATATRPLAVGILSHISEHAGCTLFRGWALCPRPTGPGPVYRDATDAIGIRPGSAKLAARADSLNPGSWPCCGRLMRKHDSALGNTCGKRTL